MIEALQRVKNSFNSYPIDSSGQCLCNSGAHRRRLTSSNVVEQVIASRERLGIALARLNFEVFPSRSNFVLVRHVDRSAESLYLDLKQSGILVRYFNKPRIDNCLRITVGSEAECDRLLAALQNILA